MNTRQLEDVWRQNSRQKEKLKEYERTIECLKNDCTTFQELHRKCKNDNTELKNEVQRLKSILQDNRNDRQMIEVRYTTVLRRLEQDLEINKNKYHKLESKLEPMFNVDSVRLKVLNQVQYSHQIEQDQLKRSIQNLKDQLLRMKRENGLLKHQLENNKLEYEDNIRSIEASRRRQTSKDHLNAISYQVCQQVENQLRGSYEQARKQAEYYKQKYFAVESRYQQKIHILNREIKELRLNV